MNIMEEIRKVKYGQLKRERTNSYITIELPTTMILDTAILYLRTQFPDWEVVHCSQFGPDFPKPQ